VKRSAHGGTDLWGFGTIKFSLRRNGEKKKDYEVVRQEGKKNQKTKRAGKESPLPNLYHIGDEKRTGGGHRGARN